MNLNRRDFLRLAGLVAGSAAVASCGPVYRELSGPVEAPVDWPARAEPHFAALRRLTFGPTAEERRTVLAHGLAAWVEDQLSQPLDDSRRVEWLLRGRDTLTMEANLLADQEKERVLDDLRSATILRRLYSRAQLTERMVEFWTDHFNIYVEKTDCWFLKPVDDRQVVRRHAMGRFSDLLSASAHSPAMLVYLDNQANDWKAPNENYARELMELHTLSVDGGYDQQDVMELARCLTGWTVKDHFWKGEFTFDPDRHDPGEKVVLDRRIEPAGKKEAEGVLRRLAISPATADHIAFKLVQKFVCDDPEADAPALVKRASQALHASNGSIPAALRPILLDGLAEEPRLAKPKFKRPPDYVLSALRMLGADTTGDVRIQEHMRAMGLGLFEWPTPDGPPEVSRQWQGNLLPRWQFAMELGRDELAGTRLPLEELAQAAGQGDIRTTLRGLSYLLLGQPLEESAAAGIADLLTEIGDDVRTWSGVLVGGLVASPAFQWR